MTGVGRYIGIVALALAMALLILLIFGGDISEVLRQLLRALTVDIGSTLRWATPLILTGIGAVIAFRAGVWNIGLDGQLYVGALAGTAVALAVSDHLGSVVGIVLVMLASMLGAALWALIPALLRVFFAAPELLTTLMFNPIAVLLTTWFVLFGPLAGTGTAVATLSTDPIDSALDLPRILAPSLASFGLIVAIAAVAVIAAYLKRSAWGFELQTFGENPKFSFYAGIKNIKVFMSSMLWSAAFAGLAGAGEILGVLHRFPARFNDDLGFDGIVVALIGGLKPVGVLVAAVFFGALRVAGANLERFASIPADMTDIVSAIVILGVATVAGRRALSIRRRETTLEDGTDPPSTGPHQLAERV